MFHPAQQALAGIRAVTSHPLSLRKDLAYTTAFVGLLVFSGCAPAAAADIVISSPTTATQYLSTGDSLTVTPTGSISMIGGPDVSVINGAVATHIENSGVLSTNTGAVTVSGPGCDVTGGIVNNAGASMTGGANAGIGSSSSADISGGIYNAGIITAKFGLELRNNGDISGGVLNDTGGTIAGGISAGIYVQSSNISGGIDNRGVISGGTGSRPYGINVVSFGDISDVIYNEAGASIKGKTAIRISSFGNISGGIVNNGMIFGSIQGIKVTSLGNVSGGIDNSGVISGPIGIRIQSGGSVSSGIVNTGTVRGTGGTAISFSGAGTTPLSLNGGHIIGNVVDSTPSAGASLVFIEGDFTTEGNFDVSSINVGAGHTLTVDGGHSITEQTLAFGVDSAASYGKLVVADGAINLTNVTVTANVGAGATLAGGEELKVGDGTAAIIGGPGGTKTAIQDNSFLWDFKMADGTAASTPTDNTDLYLFVSQAATLGGGHGKALDVLQNLGGKAGTVVQNAIDKVNAAATRQSVNHLLDSVLPGANAAPQMAAADFSNRTLNLAGDRIASLTAQETPQLLQGYAESNAGLSSFGVGTAQLADHTFVGVDLTYGQGLDETSDPNATQNGHSNYQVTLYGNNDLGDGRYVRGMAAYASSSTEIARHNVGGDGGPTATGNFDADQYLARVEAGQSFDAGRATLTPSLLLDWMHYDPQSYKEKGAGDANLNVGQKSFDTMGLGFGVATSWSYDVGGAKVKPAFSAGYKRDLMGDSISATSTFGAGGPSFTSETTPGRDHLNFGASLTYTLPANWDMKLGYTADLSRDYQSQAGTLRASLKF